MPKSFHLTVHCGGIMACALLSALGCDSPTNLKFSLLEAWPEGWPTRWCHH